jgi:hypothetical protein
VERFCQVLFLYKALVDNVLYWLKNIRDGENGDILGRKIFSGVGKMFNRITFYMLLCAVIPGIAITILVYKILSGTGLHLQEAAEIIEKLK